MFPRRLVIASLVAFLVLAHAASFAQTIPVEAVGLDADGVRLIPPTDPKFDALVRGQIRVLVDSVLGLKPYLVFLSNQSGHSVIAVQVAWDAFDETGKQLSRTYTPLMFPAAVDGTRGTGADPPLDEMRFDSEILSGEQRLLSEDASLLPLSSDASAQQPQADWQEMFQTLDQQYKESAGIVKRLRVSIDAAIFSDGTLAGPNTAQQDGGDFGTVFTSYVQARQNLFRAILAGIKEGKTVSQAFDAAAPSDPSELSDAKSTAARVRDVYRELAFDKISQLRDRVGDQAVPELFRKALRQDPFVVRASRNPG